MKNLISIVEIPAQDFARAVSFYETILNTTIEAIDMDGTTMGLFAADDGAVSVALVYGQSYKPSADGTLAYFNGGDDLQPILDKVLKQGGTIILPKTNIGPGMGFYAMFMDTEGNKLGLHSIG